MKVAETDEKWVDRFHGVSHLIDGVNFPLSFFLKCVGTIGDDGEIDDVAKLKTEEIFELQDERLVIFNGILQQWIKLGSCSCSEWLWILP